MAKKKLVLYHYLKFIAHLEEGGFTTTENHWGVLDCISNEILEDLGIYVRFYEKQYPKGFSWELVLENTDSDGYCVYLNQKTLKALIPILTRVSEGGDLVNEAEGSEAECGINLWPRWKRRVTNK